MSVSGPTAIGFVSSSRTRARAFPRTSAAKIFDRFHRAIDQGYGSGLGLAIADAVVRHTHGRWEVSTSPLGGARMVVSWSRALTGSKDQAEEDPAVSWTRPAASPPPLTD